MGDGAACQPPLCSGVRTHFPRPRFHSGETSPVRAPAPLHSRVQRAGPDDAGWGRAPCVWTGCADSGRLWHLLVNGSRCVRVEVRPAPGRSRGRPSIRTAARKERDHGARVPPSLLCLLTRGCFLSQDLIKVHHSFLRAIDVSMMAGGSSLAKVFLDFKER